MLGKNGSGKSTLIKIITGIIYPDKGSTKLVGLDSWKNRQEIASQIGVVLGAHGQLYWNLPALDTFKLMKNIYNIKESDFKKRLNYFTKILELKDVYKRQVRTLSLGEQMKCNFVASVLHMPKIVFLDEPTIGVDLSSKAALKSAIHELRNKYNMTFLLTTHIVEDIDIADRIIMLNKGKLIFNDSYNKLLHLFGDKRQVELYFKNSKNIKKRIEGKILKEEPSYLRLEVSKRSLTSKRFVSLLSDPNVIDYKVSEPGLTQIILKLYSKGKARKR